MKHGSLLLLLVGLAALAGWLWHAPGPEETAGQDVRGAADPQPAGTDRSAANAAEQPDPSRTAVTGAADEVDAGFTCTDEDGEPLADAVRDGLVVELRQADGSRAGHQKVGVYWRKGWGNYGWDRGRTEADGTFASTVGLVQHFEEFSCASPAGEFTFHGFPTPLARDPRRVVFQLPRLATMRFVVRDLQGAPVAGAWVQIQTLPLAGDGCENILSPADLDDQQTDAEGVLQVELPPGTGSATVCLDEGVPQLTAEFRVPLAGGTVDLALPQPAHRSPLQISIQAPSSAGAMHKVEVASDGPPPASRSPLVFGGWAPTHEYKVHGSSGAYWALVDALPLRVQAQSKAGWRASAKVAAGQRSVQLVLQPPEPPPAPGPVAELVVTVVRDDGRPLAGCDVSLHQAPEFHREPIADLDRNGMATVRKAATGAKLCILAKAAGTPLVLSDLLELREGRQTVTLVLPAGGTVRGVVLDAEGRPARAQVSLRRPEPSLVGMGFPGAAALPLSANEDTRWSGDDGRFELGAVGPGEHEVWARYDRLALPARAKVVAGGEVTLRPGEGFADLHLLAVQVVGAEHGEPLLRSGIRVPDALTEVYYEPEPRCHCVAVRPGTVSIEVRALDHVKQILTTTVQKGQAPLLVRMTPSPMRRVRFVDAAGGGVRDLLVTAMDPQGQPLDLLTALGTDSAAAEVDDNGCVELRGLPPGACKLRVASGRDEEQAKSAREFDLPAGAGIELRHTFFWDD